MTVYEHLKAIGEIVVLVSPALIMIGAAIGLWLGTRKMKS